MRLFGGGLRKLSRRTATIVGVLLTIALVGGIYLLLGVSANQIKQQSPAELEAVERVFVFPGAYDQILGLLLGFAGLIVVIYGAAVAGTEWTWGTMKAAVARGESRSRYVILNFAPIAVVAAIMLIGAYIAGILGAIGAAAIAGVKSDPFGDTAVLSTLPEKLVRVWIGLVEFAAMGYAIATIARSQIAGVGVAIGIYFGTSFGELVLPDILRWFPFNATSYASNLSIASTNSGAATTHGLDPNVALVVVIVWLVAALASAAVFAERAEISG